MPEVLHRCLMLLVMLDLGLVQATDVVSFQGLLPLWVLTAASPWLRRLQRFSSYRISWNVTVLLVFGLLVHHAATTGLLHMLEDGLLLAILCQVHLLNNVGERQRPDLVFFNSFLITYVTSWFVADLAWSILFAMHGLVLLVALQANVLSRSSIAWSPVLRRRLWRDGVRHGLVVGLMTSLVFLLWPRDFERKGWIGDKLPFAPRMQAGLSDRIRLDNEGAPTLGDSIVLRITPPNGSRDRVPGHWRGIAFSYFDGAAWLPQDAGLFGSRFATDLQWQSEADGGWRRRMAVVGAPLRVEQFGDQGQRLLLPAQAASLRLSNHAGVLLDPKSYGGLMFWRAEESSTTTLSYNIGLGRDSGRVHVTPASRGHLLQLPEGLPRMVRQLAGQLQGELPPDAGPDERANHVANWLKQRRRYQLPGRPGFARNFGEFVLGTGAGHCEYFASTMALLLRTMDVPCRLIGGYLAQEWDAKAGVMLARSRDAHAWVEVLMPSGEWLTIDPTPAADLPRDDQAAAHWWQRWLDHGEQFWRTIVQFDAKRRAELLAGALALPGCALAWVAGNPWTSVLVLALLAGWLRRRRRHALPQVAALQRALRNAGLRWQAGETPRDLLQRASSLPLRAQQRERLLAAVQAHEAVRFGRAQTQAPTASAIDRQQR
jgi:hypothetical protein